MRRLPLILATVAIATCSIVAAQQAPNPSAVFCEEEGGRYQTVQEAGGQRGICVLPDGREVDAWDYFRERHGVPTARSAANLVADRIWTGGNILTMDDAAMRAEAVAEKGGRIVAVGSTDTVMAHKGPDTVMIDLGGRTLLPGFVDAHGHVFMGGLQALSANMLAPPDGEVTDIASLQQTLRDWVAANAENVEKYDLIIGFGYDNAQLAELRHPTRDDLDAVSRDVPVVIIHQSGHLAALNSAALEVVGYDAATEDPEGGVIRRRAGSREPDGVLEETAFFAAIVRLMGDIGEAGARAFAEAGSELWARFGYTTAEEGRSLPSTVAMLQKIADEGGFEIDVVTYVDVLADRDFIAEHQSDSYRNRFRVAGAKLTIDGSPQGFTAWRDRPYYDPVGSYPPGYVGYPAATREQVVDSVQWAYDNDIQIITHANGEAASDLLIAAHEAAIAEHGPTATRPVLIHGQFLRSDQVDSLNRLGIMPSLFPMHTFYWGDWHRDHTVGPELADDISPTGWCVQRGMKFSSHHDAPVAFPDSMRILDATVTRRSRSGDIIGPAQRVDVITALKAMTIWPAWQHHEEATKGSIEVGKLADFAILSTDPTTVDPETLDQIEVVETIKEGVTVFELTPDERRRAALMAQPDRAGESVFGRFVSAAAHTADASAHGTHAGPCGCEFLTELAAAMTGHRAPIADPSDEGADGTTEG